MNLEVLRSLVSADLSDSELEQAWLRLDGEPEVLDEAIAAAQEQRLIYRTHADRWALTDRALRHPAAPRPLDHRRLFLATLDDVRRRATEPNDEFETLQLSVGLRKLLLDSPRLADLVNRPHRLKLSFQYVRAPRAPMDRGDGPTMLVHVDGLDALDSGEAVIEVGRDRFLSEPMILQRDGWHFTIRDVISHCANVAGGVHTGPAKGERLERLDEAVRHMPIGDMTGVIRLLPPIGRVAVRALEPLGRAVRRELGD